MGRRVTITAVVLILVSAIIHVGWNLLGKREHPTAAFLLAANTLGFLCLTPALFFFGRALPMFTAPVWGWLIVTGFFQALYYTALAGAYRAGDMSIAYPLARSAPVALVALFNLARGQIDQLTSGAMLGMALIAIGSVFLPMRRFSDWRWKNYVQAGTLLALLAALGTTGYSIIDDYALRILRRMPGSPAGGAAVTVLFAFFEGLTASLWLALFVSMSKQGRADWSQVWKTRRRQAGLAGAGIFAAYTLVLVAMGFARNVSYIVAFRQLSIPLGALVGVAVLKEPGTAPKFAGVAIMFAGLVLVGVG